MYFVIASLYPLQSYVCSCRLLSKIVLSALCMYYALQRHNTEKTKQIFPGKQLHSYRPNSYIHVSVSDLCIPLIGLPILLQESWWAECGN
jgi:hypothetical protein